MNPTELRYQIEAEKNPVLKTCESCSAKVPVHCHECELPLVTSHNLRCCPICVEVARVFMLPATCSLCDSKGVQGEMVERKNGAWLCDACFICLAGNIEELAA